MAFRDVHTERGVFAHLPIDASASAKRGQTLAVAALTGSSGDRTTPASTERSMSPAWCGQVTAYYHHRYAVGPAVDTGTSRRRSATRDPAAEAH